MRVLRLCVGVFCLSLLAAGSSAAMPNRAAVIPFAPVAGGTLNIGTSSNPPPSLNPVSSSTNAWGLYATAPVLLGAFSQQPDGTWQPGLVTSADVSTGPFTVTYHINPAAEWSDGVAVTAADFIFTWQTLTNPANASKVNASSGYSLITSMNAIDDQTVTATFSSAYAPWRSLFSPVLPEHVLTGQDIGTVWNSAIDDPGTSDPIGDGPYLVSAFDPNTGPATLTLTKNSNWWGAHAGYLNSIVVDFFVGNDQVSEVRSLTTTQGPAQIQAFYDTPPAAPSTQALFAALWSTKGFAVQSKAQPLAEHLDFNLNAGLLGDAWVRYAIAHAIDRTAIATATWSKVSPSFPASQSALLSLGEAGYAPDFGGYDYSPTKVAALMKGHGCALGGDKIWICGDQRMSFTIAYTQGNARRTLETSMMRTEAAAAGIELVPTPVNPGTFFGSTLPNSDFQLALYADLSSGDPMDWDSAYVCAGVANYTGYCNSDTDTALAAADSDLDASQRISDVNQADAQLAVDMPTLPVDFAPDFLAYSTKVGGAADNPYAGPLWNAQDVWVAGAGATPSVTSFTPGNGPIGSTIVIRGSGFTGTTSVTIGGMKAKSFKVVGDNVVSAVVAPGTLTGAITITTAAGNVTSSGSFTVGPTIASFTPATGTGGTGVTITGSGFTAATAVTFGGTNAQNVSIVSDSKITAVVAAGSTTGPVEVAGPGGTATSLKSFAFPLSVGSPAPDHGPIGTSVAISGSGFTGATAVKFGGTSAQGFTVDSDVQITAVVAPGTKTGKITVTGPAGTATSSGPFTVSLGISSFSPTKGPTGSTVTITGSGLTGATAVQFAGTDAQSYIVVSDTKITAVVAAGTLSGTISVAGPSGSATSGAAFTVGPKIDSFSPTSGPAPTLVTIHGSGFTGASAVKIGSASAQGYSVDSDSQITAEVAPGAAGGKVVVTGPGGTATSANNFAVTLGISSLAPAKGPIGSTVTITGSGFTDVTAVHFSGAAAQSFAIVSNTKITAVVQAGTTNGPITVTSVAGTATSAGSFAPSTSIASFTPGQAMIGTTVTISGSGFTGATAVTINGKNAQTFSVDSDGQITATVAYGTTSGKIVVATPAGGATSASALTVISITSFTPAQGPVGTTVKITGSGFVGTTEVSFNNEDAQSYTVVSDTTINAVVAPGTTSGVISVHGPAGIASSASSFILTFAIRDVAVCPTSDSTNGVCNQDWSGSPFAPADDLLCSFDIQNAGGHTIEIDLLLGSVAVDTWVGGSIPDQLTEQSLEYNPGEAIPNGSYSCRIKVDGVVAATKAFKISQ